MAAAQQQADPGGGGSPRAGTVLELRIHGVSNTPPAAVLDLPPSAVVQVDGDALGGFWAPSTAALADLLPYERGYVPPGIVRQAYSWGGLARTTPGGTYARLGAAGTALAVLARIGWALLLPFGVANIGYWTRRLPEQGAPAGWRAGNGAASARLFALCLTLLFVVSVGEVSLDLVASQCFAGGARVCENLPAALDLMAGWSRGARLAVMSLVPLAALLLLGWLGAVSRARYDDVTDGPAVAEGTDPVRPVLATPGFWSHRALSTTTARLHVAAGLAVLVMGTAWHQVLGGGTACTTVTGALSAACREQVGEGLGRSWPFAATFLLALAVLLAVVALLCRASEAAPDVPVSGRRTPHRGVAAALVVAAGCFGTHLVLLAVVPVVSADGTPLLGLLVAPALAAGAGLGFAAAALAWRRAGVVVAGWLGLLLVVGLVVAVRTPGAGAGIVAAAGVALLLVRRRGVDDLARTAWSGRAPGVFLLLALAAAMTLSSLLVLTAGDYLNGGRGAADLLRARAELPVTVPGELSVPAPYAWFGATTLLVLVALVLVAVVVWVSTAGTVAPDRPRQVPGAGHVGADHARVLRAGSIDELLASPQITADANRARRVAAYAQRAEPAVGVLAGLSAVAVAAAVVLGVADRVPSLDSAGWADRLVARVLDVGVLALAFAGLALVGSLAAGAVRGRSRPLGLAWDLMCFLPRAAHPFGPPCYAERVVPELVRRYRWWLYHEPPRPGGPPLPQPRRILLSAHSLGSVLAAASVFALPAPEPGRRGTVTEVSLLTYGSQLRAYFGRMFPELLGPQALGNAPCRSASLWTVDPWARDIAAPLLPAPGPCPGSLAQRLGGDDGAPPRWLDLYRRTDVIGFPVQGYAPNDVDRAAEEIDNSGYLALIGGHSDYPRTSAYARAVDEVLGRSEPGAGRQPVGAAPAREAPSARDHPPVQVGELGRGVVGQPGVDR